MIPFYPKINLKFLSAKTVAVTSFLTCSSNFNRQSPTANGHCSLTALIKANARASTLLFILLTSSLEHHLFSRPVLTHQQKCPAPQRCPASRNCPTNTEFAIATLSLP